MTTLSNQGKMPADTNQKTDLFGEVPKYYGNGYAAAPGTGPTGKGAGTDISMHSPACRLFVQLKDGDAV